ncbi:MAG: GspH/FimT family protein [Pseudomonadota bacterium]
MIKPDKGEGDDMENRGFTLVELLVVLAVGSILLAIAVPGYAYLANTSRAAAATNDLMTALQLARSEAIKRATRVTVCKTGDAMAAAPACDPAAAWEQGWLVFVDGGTRGLIDGGDLVLRVQGGVPNVAITAPRPNFSRYVSYKADGSSQGMNNLGTGTLAVCAGGKRRDIIINNAGRPRLETGTC